MNHVHLAILTFQPFSDIAPPNVMMDGRALYPNGHHPVRWKFSEDAVYEVTPLSRLEHPVRYFYIDFGISIRFSDGAPPQATGVIGRYKEAPEMSYDLPYDAYKIDVWALGNLFRKEFLEVRPNFPSPLPAVKLYTIRRCTMVSTSSSHSWMRCNGWILQPGSMHGRPWRRSTVYVLD